LWVTDDGGEARRVFAEQPRQGVRQIVECNLLGDQRIEPRVFQQRQRLLQPVAVAPARAL